MNLIVNCFTEIKAVHCQPWNNKNPQNADFVLHLGTQGMAKESLVSCYTARNWQRQAKAASAYPQIQDMKFPASWRLPGLLSPNGAGDVSRLLFNFPFRWRNKSMKEGKEMLCPSFLFCTLAIPDEVGQREKRCLTSSYQSKEPRCEQQFCLIWVVVGFFIFILLF